MHLSERLKLVFDEHPKLSQAGLARACGISRASVNAWFSGKTDSIDGKHLTTAATYLGVNAHWLSTGQGQRSEKPDETAEIPAKAINLENNPDYPAIRRVRFKLSAGATGFSVDYHDEEGAPIVFQKAWYANNGLNPKALFAVGVCNASMEPGMHCGDTVVVNTASTEPKDGHVFAINYEGEMVIKRLVRDAGQWWLSSDNQDQRRYPRKLCDEHCVLIGEVVHKQSMRI